MLIMIRVAHIWRKTGAGGSEATFARLYAALDHQQMQWDFLVESTGLFVDRAKIEKLGGRVILLPPLTKPRVYQRELKKILADGHYDIVHAHMNELSYYPLKAAKSVGIPIRIAHAHSGSHPRDGMKHWIKRYLRPKVAKVATHAWGVSRQAANQMFPLNSRLPVTVFYNALNLTPLQFDAAARVAMREKLEIGNHQLVVGHVGRLTRQKNQRWLLRCFAEVVKRTPQALLLVVGDGKDRLRLQNLAERLKITAQVHFVGEQADLAPYYQAMDVFVLPSLYEGLPGGAVEAQANGLPCVLAETITRETACGEGVWFLPFKHVEPWAKTILVAAQARGQITVDTTAFAQFDVARQASRLTALYQSYYQGGAA